jgi:hypothetical protein
MRCVIVSRRSEWVRYFYFKQTVLGDIGTFDVYRGLVLGGVWIYLLWATV